MQEIAKKRNGKCLSNEYINIDTKLRWKCDKGHEWETIPYLIKKGCWCPECANRKKHTIEKMQEIAKKRDGECISNEYINLNLKLEWKCNKGHKWKASPIKIIKGTWCPVCSREPTYTINDMKKIAINRNGKCLSNEYVNSSSKLEWECEHGHKWKASPNQIKSNKTWCPICFKNKTMKTIEDAHNLAKLREGECLSNKYINVFHNLKWKCNKGHEWKAAFHNVESGNWCPICRESRGENKIATFLRKNNIQFERQKTFEECKNIRKLPFDFYLPKYNILIEFDGEQHFNPNCYHNKKYEFSKIKNNDNTKTNFCTRNNIILIRIKYDEKNIDNFLSEKFITNFIDDDDKNQK